MTVNELADTFAKLAKGDAQSQNEWGLAFFFGAPGVAKDEVEEGPRRDEGSGGSGQVVL